MSKESKKTNGGGYNKYLTPVCHVSPHGPQNVLCESFEPDENEDQLEGYSNVTTVGGWS